MRLRSLAAVTTALATLGLALTASAAPPSGERHASPRLVLDGLVVDWDPAASSITLEDPDVRGGNRAVRRAFRSLAEVEVGVGPRTRIVAEDEGGFRDRITADELFVELDESADELDVEVVVRSAAGAKRGHRADARVSAKRVVLYLASEQDEEPGDAGDEEPPPPADDVIEEPAPEG